MSSFEKKLKTSSEGTSLTPHVEKDVDWCSILSDKFQVEDHSNVGIEEVLTNPEDFHPEVQTRVLEQSLYCLDDRPWFDPRFDVDSRQIALDCYQITMSNLLDLDIHQRITITEASQLIGVNADKIALAAFNGEVGQPFAEGLPPALTKKDVLMWYLGTPEFASHE